MYYFWDCSDIYNKKEFNLFMNNGKIFDIFRDIEKMRANSEKMPKTALIKKFSNDK